MRLLVVTAVLMLALASPAAAELQPGYHDDTVQELASVDVAGAVGQAKLRSLDVGVAASNLPLTWCGTATTSDDTADATFGAALPQFKLVYAYPSDRPNRFSQWADALQADVSLIEQFVSSQPGSARAPRFDMGTSCGPQYVDIQSVALPGTRSGYVQNMSAVEAYVKTRLNPSPGGPRNVVVLADTLSSGGLNGVGELYEGSSSSDRPDAANVHNQGGLTSVMWALDSTAPGTNPNGWWPEGVLHEMTHNMGGVQWTAPHTSQPSGGSDYTYSHCWDGRDVMCYQDGPSMGHAYSTSVCAAIAGAMPQTYDCGQDDYFNPAPQSGSYLATHWDVYNSVFMADCGTLPSGACIDSQASGVPFNTVRPTVSGTAQVGETLTGTIGTWDPAGVSYEYQWQRDGVAIPSATSATYVATTADRGHKLALAVTAIGAGGTRMKATSDLSGPIAGAQPQNTVAPAISGDTTLGAPLTGSIGTWSPAGTTYLYQWQRLTGAGAVDIQSATTSSYRTTATDRGYQLQLRVTASNADGVVKATSAPFGPIRAIAPVNTAAPTVSGDARTGALLVGSVGAWNPSGSSYALQWQRVTGGRTVDITGASGPTYRTTASDRNARIQLRVTAAGGDAPVVAVSAPLGPIVPQPPVATVKPSISGSPVVGTTLTGARGTWNPAATTYSYQWQRVSATKVVDIARATASTYRPTAADKGAKLQLRVQGANTDGLSASASTPFGPIAAAAASATVAAGASSTLRTSAGVAVANASVSGGARAAAARRSVRLTVTVRRARKARGSYRVTVCSGAAAEPCAPAKTLGKRPLRIAVASTASRVRIAVSRH